ncbi:hypothetical protein JCM10212_003035 [Sporobolomyces blumeae]
MLIRPLVSLAGGSPAVKLEKTRQKIASLHVTNVYVWVMAGVLGLFVLRNFALVVQRFVSRRRRSTATAAGEKDATLRGPKPSLLRLSDRLDSIALRPCNLPFVPQEWSWLRLVLTVLIAVANIVCCLVVAVSSPIPNQAGSSVARAFSRRCGRVAVANYPMIYCFAGRNSIVATLTGVSYQELRFYHILIGGIAFLESFIHTFAYIGHYLRYQTAEKLREEYSELYFKMGIVAVVFMFANCVFGLKWLRRRSYEIFLALHVIGAALILAGSWYHRPIIVPWVYTAVAIWAFERVSRLVWHVSTVVHSHVVVRRPLVQARASVVAGAIKLAVPFPGGRWEAGQHAYITVWGTHLLRSPWFIGQPHPFSISNVPDSALGVAQEMRFVLRVHKGMTRTLARHVEAKCQALGKNEVPITIGLEGPHGWSAEASDFDSILLLAGGSGITHPLSVVADVCQKASKGLIRTSQIKIVWALHRLEQLEWVRETVEEARELATKAGLSLTIKLHVTRPTASSSTSSQTSSGTSTPTESPSLSSIDDDEKKADFGQLVPSFAGARHFVGRPDIAEEISSLVAESADVCLVIACGPASLANEVRRASLGYPGSSLRFEVASFEC